MCGSSFFSKRNGKRKMVCSKTKSKVKEGKVFNNEEKYKNMKLGKCKVKEGNTNGGRIRAAHLQKHIFACEAVFSAS